jgi:CRP-like cAMP-binding protein
MADRTRDFAEASQRSWLDQGITAGDPELLDGPVLDRLAAIAAVRTVQPGEIVAQAGARTDHVIVVRDGELELSVSTTGGHRILALVRPGGVVGDVAALCGMPMPVDAVAIRECRVMECDLERVLEMLSRSPDLALRWMTSLACRLLASHRHALALLRKDLVTQVAALLLLEQDPTPDGPPTVRLSQEAIAQLLGASRQSISRVLSGFRKRGLVRTGYRSVVLLQREALADIAGEPTGVWDTPSLVPAGRPGS